MLTTRMVLPRRQKLIDATQRELAAKKHYADEISRREHDFDVGEITEVISQTYAANYAAGLEIDKTLLTLASAGIGVLISLAGTKEDLSKVALILYLCALWFFFTTIFAALVSLYENKKITLAVIKNQEVSDWRAELSDFIARVSFILGAIFTISLGALLSLKPHLAGIFK